MELVVGGNWGEIFGAVLGVAEEHDGDDGVLPGDVEGPFDAPFVVGVDEVGGEVVGFGCPVKGHYGAHYLFGQPLAFVDARELGSCAKKMQKWAADKLAKPAHAYGRGVKMERFGKA